MFYSYSNRETDNLRRNDESLDNRQKRLSASLVKKNDSISSKLLQKHHTSSSSNHFHFNFSKKGISKDKDAKSNGDQYLLGNTTHSKKILSGKPGLMDSSNFSSLLKKVTTALYDIVK